MQIRNNYDKEIYNGDIGVISDIDRRAYRVVVNFEGREVIYSREDMNELVLAFAIPGASYGFDVGRSSRSAAIGTSVSAVVGTLLVAAVVLIPDLLRYWR